MLRMIFVLLLVANVTTGCMTASLPGTPVVNSSFVTADGAARMQGAKSLRDRWDTARKLCNEAGLETATDVFLRCFKEYQGYVRRVQQPPVKALTDEVARKYGLCIDRRRFEFVRCAEI
jgi:hypothetical protein